MRALIACTLLVAACTPVSNEVPLEGDFELAPGRSVTIAGTGHTVTFDSVGEDSRCPTGVTCVWAGNARVGLRVGVAGRDSAVTLNTGLEPRAVTIGSLTLELKAVNPAPQAGAPTPAASYRITLRASGS